MHLKLRLKFKSNHIFTPKNTYKSTWRKVFKCFKGWLFHQYGNLELFIASIQRKWIYSLEVKLWVSATSTRARLFRRVGVKLFVWSEINSHSLIMIFHFPLTKSDLKLASHNNDNRLNSFILYSHLLSNYYWKIPIF